MTPALPYVWRDGSWRPLPRFVRQAADAFADGDVLTLEEREDRSPLHHRWYFRAVNEAWKSLPERFGDRWPSPKHLRRYALIRTGYRDESSMVCASRAEALRVAAFMRPVDTCAVVVVQGAVVTRYTAKSQRGRAMDKKTFGASADAVLALLADLIGVEPAQLERARAA